jgi:hypothetical protein
MRALPVGGVKSFRRPTNVSAVMLDVRIHSEELKLSVLTAARRATLVFVTSSKA